MRQYDRAFAEQARPLLEIASCIRWSKVAAALPKSPLGAATGYALRNWAAWTPALKTGASKSTSRRREQALRPIVLGRKNWLFAGSEAGQRTDRHPAFTRPDLQAPAGSTSLSTCAMSSSAFRLPSGATGPEPTPREWKCLRQRSGACRLNGGLLITKSRLRPVSIDLNLRLDRYLRPPSSLSTAGRWR